jgi:hypothetical protein
MSEGATDRPMDVEFTQFNDDSTTVALITDVTNERAWIQSTLAVEVER